MLKARNYAECREALTALRPFNNGRNFAATTIHGVYGVTSYSTVIALVIDGVALVPANKHSVTTSKQQTHTRQAFAAAGLTFASAEVIETVHVLVNDGLSLHDAFTAALALEGDSMTVAA